VTWLPPYHRAGVVGAVRGRVERERLKVRGKAGKLALLVSNLGEGKGRRRHGVGAAGLCYLGWAKVGRWLVC
jgi:hypothetical protein